MKKLRLLLFLLLAFGCGAQSPTAAASTYDPGQQFQQIRDYYQRLLIEPAGQDRANWLRAAQGLQRLQQENPAHEVAPQSLFLLGVLYHQLYRRNHNQLDLAEAITYLQDMQATHPRHHLADDALFYLANIFLHDRKEPDRATRAFSRIIALYPDGDMAPSARGQLRALRASPAAVIDGLAEVMPIRHWSSDSYTRVVIETSEPLTYRSHMLANGDDSRRLYIDLDEVRLSSRIAETETAIEDGLLKRIRLAQRTPDSVRVVLDTQNRIDDYKIFNLNNPARVVIDLLGQGQPEPQQLRIIQPARPLKVSPARIDPGAPARPLSLAQQLGLGIRRVVIDPGHGGRDPGAIGPSGIKEKDVTLRVAKLLAAVLRKSLNSEVILTRDRDIFLPLEERTAIANSRDADLFISIHVNSAPARDARGVETYVLDMVASDDEALRVAARENASSARSFSDLQNIVHKLLNNTKLQESVNLATFVQETMVESLRRTYGGRINDRGVRRAPFVVLIGARMPALMVEVGFLSNPNDERLLTDERYLDQVAQSIADGIRQYATNLNIAAR